MINLENLLRDLEARRDLAYMDAKEARVKADTLDYVVTTIRNAIIQDKAEIDNFRAAIKQEEV
jgi:hypothetical protein